MYLAAESARRKHMESVYACDLCNSRFDSEEKLTEHLKSHFSPN